MAYDITVEDREAQPTLAIRRMSDAASLQPAIAACLGGAFQFAASRNAPMAGPPYTRFREGAGGQIEVEGGVPMASPFEGEGEVLSLELPAGPSACLTHIGSYDGLSGAHAALEQWARDNGREASGPPWDVYLTDPQSQPDPSQWMTRIYLPLKS